VERIALLGCAGAGKTTLAYQLSDILDCPVAHLDQLRYDEDWNESSQATFAAAQQELLRQRRLICDGNYLSVLPERLAWADTVIWLDYSPVLCLWRVMARFRRYGPGQHDQGVFVRITWPFLRYVATYRRRHAPRVRAVLDECGQGCQVITLRRPRDTAALLDLLREAAMAPPQE
jgi:adenylate kinase family enzyme